MIINWYLLQFVYWSKGVSKLLHPFFTRFFFSGRVKWGTRDIMWARIWSKTLQNAWNISTIILFNFHLLLHSHLNYLGFYWTHSPFTSSRSKNLKNVCSIHQVSYPRTICLLSFTEHFEVSPNTIHCSPFSNLFTNPTNPPYWDYLCTCTCNFPSFHWSSNRSFYFIMDCSDYVSRICPFFQKV